MICKRCGKENPEYCTHCSCCGKRLKRTGKEIAEIIAGIIAGILIVGIVSVGVFLLCGIGSAIGTFVENMLAEDTVHLCYETTQGQKIRIDKDGNLTRTLPYKGIELRWVYDKKGNLKECSFATEEETISETGGKIVTYSFGGKNPWKEAYTYDADNHILEMAVYKEGVCTGRTEYINDEDGQVLESTEYVGEEVVDHRIFVYTHDKNGNLLEVTGFDDSNTVVYRLVYGYGSDTAYEHKGRPWFKEEMNEKGEMERIDYQWEDLEGEERIPRSQASAVYLTNDIFDETLFIPENYMYMII